MRPVSVMVDGILFGNSFKGRNIDLGLSIQGIGLSGQQVGNDHRGNHTEDRQNEQDFCQREPATTSRRVMW